MEDIIHAFGIDQRLIIIQIVNFALLAAALGYFLYKPVLKLLAEREEKIAQGLKDAELAAMAKSEADKEKQVVLTLAHQESAAIAERAKAVADTQAGEIVSDAQVKAAALLKDAEAKGEMLKQEALSKSEKEIAQLAMLATEKLLREKA
jgi:F-type H+-transporting ATPase subunit b